MFDDSIVKVFKDFVFMINVVFYVVEYDGFLVMNVMWGDVEMDYWGGN